jgi:hypothetical protein
MTFWAGVRARNLAPERNDMPDSRINLPPTARQKETLTALLDGPASIPAVTAFWGVNYGYMEKTGESGGRARAHVRITDKGRAAL